MSKIAVAGNQWITEYLITHFIDAGHPPSLIINLAPKNARKISGYTDLHSIASKNNIPLYRPEKYSLKSDIDQQLLCKNEIDILFVFGWQRLIPDWLINHCSNAVYGVHGGPFRPPRARGQAVFNWSLILGYSRFYMYLFQINSGVDSGGIVEMVQFDILPSDDITSLYHKNCIVSTKMILKNLPSILTDNVRLEPQKNDGATYLPKRKPENSGINWQDPAERIANLVRAVAPPYPCAFTYFTSQKIEIIRAHVFDTKITFNTNPGEIIDYFPNGDLLVATGAGELYVREYRCANGIQLKKGNVFSLQVGEQLPDPLI